MPKSMSDCLLGLTKLSIVMVMGGLAPQAGEIRGTITGEEGRPLSGIPVCLSLQSNGACARVESTNIQGEYVFGGVFDSVVHTVRVLTQDPATACRSEGSEDRPPSAPGREARIPSRQNFAHSHLVWEPQQAEAQLTSGFDSITADFSGVFGFSNYRPSLCLTKASFPELVEFDTPGDPPFLKLYTWIGDERDSQDLIYLGRVSNPDDLRIEVSVPHSVSELHYDLYSVTQSVSGVYRLNTTTPPDRKQPPGGKARPAGKVTR